MAVTVTPPEGSGAQPGALGVSDPATSDDLVRRAEEILRGLQSRDDTGANGVRHTRDAAAVGAQRPDLDARVTAAVEVAKLRTKAIVEQTRARTANPSAGTRAVFEMPAVASNLAPPPTAPRRSFEADEAFFAALRGEVDEHATMGTQPLPAPAAEIATVVTPEVVAAPEARATPVSAAVEGPETLLETAAEDLSSLEPAPEALTREQLVERQRRKARTAFIGLVIRDVSLLALLFLAYTFFGTSFFAGDAQRALQREFAGQSKSNAAPKPGTAVAMLDIPTIGLKQAVIEGTSVGNVRRGPAHFGATPLPGQPGNAVITGARTTYGAPFERLDELSFGDKIRVTTHQGKFTYVVKAQRVVAGSNRDLLVDHHDNRLTLTSAHPKLSTSQRLIVWATLDPSSTPAVPTSKAPLATKATLSAEDPGWLRDGGMWLPSMFWALVLVGAYAGMLRLATRWGRPKALALGLPVLVLLMWPLFVNLGRAFPANL